MDKKLIHKGCGGFISSLKCSKCNKQWGKLGFMFSSDIEDITGKFNPSEYRKRIREGRDIFK